MEPPKGTEILFVSIALTTAERTLCPSVSMHKRQRPETNSNKYSVLTRVVCVVVRLRAVAVTRSNGHDDDEEEDKNRKTWKTAHM